MCRAIRQASRDARSGASLLELTVTVLILGIIAAIASPKYSISLQRYRTDVAAQRIAQDLSRARQVARTINTSCIVSFNRSLHQYTISGMTSLDNRGGTYRVEVNQSPYSSSLLSLTSSDQPTIQLSTMSIAFDRFGIPNQGASIIVGTGAIQKRVDVAPLTGKVSIQ